MFRILIEPNKNCKIPPLYLIVGIDWEIQRIAGKSSDHRNHLTQSYHKSPTADTTAANSNSPQQQHGETKKSLQTGERQQSYNSAELCQPMHSNTQHFRSIKQFIEQSALLNVFCLAKLIDGLSWVLLSGLNSKEVKQRLHENPVWSWMLRGSSQITRDTPSVINLSLVVNFTLISLPTATLSS